LLGFAIQTDESAHHAIGPAKAVLQRIFPAAGFARRGVGDVVFFDKLVVFLLKEINRF